MLDFVFVAAAIILFLFFINVSFKHAKPVKTAVVNMLGGIVCLAASSVVMGLFGVSVMVNIYTVLVAMALGIPGVAAIIIYLAFV